MPTTAFFLRFVLIVTLYTTTIIPLTAAFKWHRHGLGRTIHIFNNNHTTDADDDANIFLLTSLGTIANLDATTATIRWRVPPPLSATPITPLAAVALQPPHPRLLLVLLSDHTLRAIDPETAVIVWHVPACRLALPASDLVRIATCDGRVYAINPSSGLMSDDHTSSSSNSSLPFLALPSLASESDSLHDLQWPLSNYRVLTSFADGTLRLASSATELWRREDGISHVTAGAIFSVDGHAVVVVLSQLGAVFALRDHHQVLWKVPVGRHCILLTELTDRAVIVCTNEPTNETVLYAIRVSDGTLTFTKSIRGFRAVRASVDTCCGDAVCVVAVDDSGREEWLSECNASSYSRMPGSERGWLLYSKGGRFVRGVRGGATVWRIAMPNLSKLSAVITTRAPHAMASNVRPPAVRVTGSRQLLRKFVDENVILVLSHDETRAEVHAMLVDSNTGALHSAVSHRNAHAPIAGVKGDHWFVYTFWNAVMLQQEIHIVDMYHRARNGSWVGETLRAAVRALFGTEIMNAFGIPDPEYALPCAMPNASATGSLQCTTKPSDATMPFAHARPVLLRSSALLRQRVVALDVTETTSGITESAVIMTLENGQVSLVSKFRLDARQHETASVQHQAELLLPYKPVLSLESSAGQSIYVAEGRHVHDIKQVAVAPCRERESTTLIAVLGMDVVFSLVQPVGKFDTLQDDFLYSAVVAMIVFLAGGVFYSQQLKVRASLSRSW